MKLTKRLSLTILIAAGVAFTSQVQAREFADIYTECGLGAMIAPNNDVVAAITNVTWDLGTTAISSNASSEDMCKGGTAATAAIIYSTYPALEKDIVNGHGQHLTALLNVSGIDASDQPALIAQLRPGFAEVIASNNYSKSSREEKSEALFNLLNSKI